MSLGNPGLDLRFNKKRLQVLVNFLIHLSSPCEKLNKDLH